MFHYVCLANVTPDNPLKNILLSKLSGGHYAEEKVVPIRTILGYEPAPSYHNVMHPALEMKNARKLADKTNNFGISSRVQCAR